MTKAPLWKFAEETPPGSQTGPKYQTATTQAHPFTSTPAKPSGSQIQAPARAQPQAAAQVQTRPPAPAQPPRLASAYFPQPQAPPPWGARRVPSKSLHDEDRLSNFPKREASLIAKQASSELQDRVANFCELEGTLRIRERSW